MSQQIAFQFVGDASSAVKAGEQVERTLDGVASKSEKTGGILSGIGNIATGALGFAGGAILTKGLDILSGSLGDSLQQSLDNQKGQLGLQQALSKTASTTGVTSDMANDLASSLQLQTKFEDDDVTAAETVLARFSEIGQQTFPDATKATLDLATAMGTDSVSAAKTLGKVLATGAGLPRLRAAGIVFTKDQEKLIATLYKTGNAAQGQKLILDNLSSTIGGTAVAAGKTFEGQQAILGHIMDDLKQSVGDALLPLLMSVGSALISLFQNPAVQSGIKSLVGGITTIFTQVGNLFNVLMSGDDIAQGFGEILDNIFGNTGNLVEPIRAIVQAILDLGSAFASLLSGGGDTSGIGNFVSGIITTLQSAFGGLIDWITGSLVPVLSDSFSQIATAAGPAFTQLAGWINGTLLPGLQNLATIVGPILSAGFGALGSLITTQVIPILTQLIVWILTQGLPAFGNFANIIGGLLNGALSIMSGLWNAILSAFQTIQPLIGQVQDALGRIANFISSSVQGIVSGFADVVGNLAGGLKSVWEFGKDVIDMLHNLAAAIASIDLSNIWALIGHSPAPLAVGLASINKELAPFIQMLPRAAGTIGTSMHYGQGSAMTGGSATAGNTIHIDTINVRDLSPESLRLWLESNYYGSNVLVRQRMGEF